MKYTLVCHQNTGTQSKIANPTQFILTLWVLISVHDLRRLKILLEYGMKHYSTWMPQIGTEQNHLGFTPLGWALCTGSSQLYFLLDQYWSIYEYDHVEASTLIDILSDRKITHVHHTILSLIANIVLRAPKDSILLSQWANVRHEATGESLLELLDRISLNLSSSTSQCMPRCIQKLLAATRQTSLISSITGRNTLQTLIEHDTANWSRYKASTRLLTAHAMIRGTAHMEALYNIIYNKYGIEILIPSRVDTMPNLPKSKQAHLYVVAPPSSPSPSSSASPSSSPQHSPRSLSPISHLKERKQASQAYFELQVRQKGMTIEQFSRIVQNEYNALISTPSTLYGSLGVMSIPTLPPRLSLLNTLMIMIQRRVALIRLILKECPHPSLFDQYDRIGYHFLDHISSTFLHCSSPLLLRLISQYVRFDLYVNKTNQYNETATDKALYVRDYTKLQLINEKLPILPPYYSTHTPDGLVTTQTEYHMLSHSQSSFDTYGRTWGTVNQLLIGRAESLLTWDSIRSAEESLAAQLRKQFQIRCNGTYIARLNRGQALGYFTPPIKKPSSMSSSSSLSNRTILPRPLTVNTSDGDNPWSLNNSLHQRSLARPITSASPTPSPTAASTTSILLSSASPHFTLTSHLPPPPSSYPPTTKDPNYMDYIKLFFATVCGTTLQQGSERLKLARSSHVSSPFDTIHTNSANQSSSSTHSTTSLSSASHLSLSSHHNNNNNINNNNNNNNQRIAGPFIRPHSSLYHPYDDDQNSVDSHSKEHMSSHSIDPDYLSNISSSSTLPSVVPSPPTTFKASSSSLHQQQQSSCIHLPSTATDDDKLLQDVLCYTVSLGDGSLPNILPLFSDIEIWKHDLRKLYIPLHDEPLHNLAIRRRIAYDWALNQSSLLTDALSSIESGNMGAQTYYGKAVKPNGLIRPHLCTYLKNPDSCIHVSTLHPLPSTTTTTAFPSSSSSSFTSTASSSLYHHYHPSGTSGSGGRPTATGQTDFNSPAASLSSFDWSDSLSDGSGGYIDNDSTFPLSLNIMSSALTLNARLQPPLLSQVSSLRAPDEPNDSDSTASSLYNNKPKSKAQTVLAGSIGSLIHWPTATLILNGSLRRCLTTLALPLRYRILVVDPAVIAYCIEHNDLLLFEQYHQHIVFISHGTIPTYHPVNVQWRSEIASLHSEVMSKYSIQNNIIHEIAQTYPPEVRSNVQLPSSLSEYTGPYILYGAHSTRDPYFPYIAANDISPPLFETLCSEKVSGGKIRPSRMKSHRTLLRTNYFPQDPQTLHEARKTRVHPTVSPVTGLGTDSFFFVDALSGKPTNTIDRQALAVYPQISSGSALSSHSITTTPEYGLRSSYPYDPINPSTWVDHSQDIFSPRNLTMYEYVDLLYGESHPDTCASLKESLQRIFVPFHHPEYYPYSYDTSIQRISYKKYTDNMNLPRFLSGTFHSTVFPLVHYTEQGEIEWSHTPHKLYTEIFGFIKPFPWYMTPNMQKVITEIKTSSLSSSDIQHECNIKPIHPNHAIRQVIDTVYKTRGVAPPARYTNASTSSSDSIIDIIDDNDLPQEILAEPVPSNSLKSIRLPSYLRVWNDHSLTIRYDQDSDHQQSSYRKYKSALTRSSTDMRMAYYRDMQDYWFCFAGKVCNYYEQTLFKMTLSGEIAKMYNIPLLSSSVSHIHSDDTSSFITPRSSPVLSASPPSSDTIEPLSLSPSPSKSSSLPFIPSISNNVVVCSPELVIASLSPLHHIAEALRHASNPLTRRVLFSQFRSLFQNGFHLRRQVLLTHICSLIMMDDKCAVNNHRLNKFNSKVSNDGKDCKYPYLIPQRSIRTQIKKFHPTPARAKEPDLEIYYPHPSLLPPYMLHGNNHVDSSGILQPRSHNHLSAASQPLTVNLINPDGNNTNPSFQSGPITPSSNGYNTTKRTLEQHTLTSPIQRPPTPLAMPATTQSDQAKKDSPNTTHESGRSSSGFLPLIPLPPINIDDSSLTPVPEILSGYKQDTRKEISDELIIPRNAPSSSRSDFPSQHRHHPRVPISSIQIRSSVQGIVWEGGVPSTPLHSTTTDALTVSASTLSGDLGTTITVTSDRSATSWGSQSPMSSWANHSVALSPNNSTASSSASFSTVSEIVTSSSISTPKSRPGRGLPHLSPLVIQDDGIHPDCDDFSSISLEASLEASGRTPGMMSYLIHNVPP